MRGFEIVLAPLVVLAVLAGFRVHFDWVMSKVTDDNQPGYHVMPEATPFQPLCRANDCNLLPSLYPSPWKGLSAP